MAIDKITVNDTDIAEEVITPPITFAIQDHDPPTVENSNEVPVVWDVTLGEGGGKATAWIDANQIDHKDLLNLAWFDSGHISELDVVSYAAFDNDGGAILKVVDTVAEEVNALLDHSVLVNMDWEDSGHISGEEVSTVATFDDNGNAALKTFEQIAAIVGARLDHSDLQSLNWEVSGHSGDEGTIAAFSQTGGEAIFVTPQDVVNGAVISHASLTGQAWSGSGHTGTANSFAGFNGSGAAAYATAQEIVNQATISHADLEDLAWVGSGHEGTAGKIAGFSTVDGSAVEVDAATLVQGGFPAFIRPTFSVKGVEWMAIDNSATGSHSYFANTIHYTLHHEECASTTYDAMAATCAVGATGTSMVYALYSQGSNGNPGTLLWSCSAVSCSTTGSKPVTFASGTWTTAGNAYKDGSSRLVLTRGQSIYRAVLLNGTVQLRDLNTPRALGADPNAGSVFTHFEETSTYPTFPSSATPVSQSTRIPVLVLRWV